jgi:hypothetical protein
MRLVYDPRELTGVMTARPGVARVLQLLSELTVMVSRARMSQMINIQ